MSRWTCCASRRTVGGGGCMVQVCVGASSTVSRGLKANAEGVEIIWYAVHRADGSGGCGGV